MLGLYNYIANSKAVQSIVRGGLQLFYKADRTQAPLGEEQVLNNSFDELGAELVTDADFTTDSFWTKETNINILGGKAVFNTSSDNTGIFRSNITADGKTYKAQIEITDYTSGAVQFNYNGVFIGSFNTVGTHTAYFVAGGDNLFGIQSDVTADLSLGSASLKQVDPNDRWTLEAGWRINNGKVAYNGSISDNAISQISVTSGRNYKLEFTIEDYVSGTLNVALSDGSLGNNSIAANGTYSFNITATGTLCAFRSTDRFKGSITNVSVKEITNSIKDHSKNSNDGTLYSGKALNFDGDGDGVQLNTAQDISILGDYTIAFWFKRNNTSDSLNTIYHNSKDVNNRTGVHWTADNKITFNSYSAAANYQGINSPVLDKDKWYRVVAVAKGGVKTLYINNENNPTSGGAVNSYLPSPNEFLGGGADANCDGAVADFQLYDKAWNATDVKYDWENPDKDVFDRVDEAQALGEELVTNGDFALNSNWSEGVGWDVAGNGFATCDGSQTGTSNLRQDIYTPGKVYKTIITVNSVTAGSILIFTGTANSQLTITEAGTYAITIYALTSNSLYIQADASFDGSISNVSVREVTTHASHILPTDCKSLLRLNEGAGDRVYDAAPVLGAEEVQNGTFELGSELSVNGDFINTLSPNTVEGASGTSNITWDSQAGGSAKLIYNSNDNTGLFLKIPAIIENGKNYYISIDTTTITDGSKIKILGNDDQEIKVDIGNGTTNFSFVAQHSVDNIRIYRQDASQSSQLYINSFTIKEIPSWSFGDGWSYVDGKASLVQVGGPQATDYLKQELTGLVDGRTYVVGFDLDITSATVTTIGLSSTGAFGNIPNVRFHETSGRKTFTGIYDSSHQGGIKELRFVGGSDTEFTIDNVSVQEYGVSGYWRNNGADQWDDLSIGSSHGTVSGSPTEIFLQEVPFFGKDSLGMFMNKPRLGGLNLNTSGYVGIEDNNDLDFGTGAFTMECWVVANFTAQGSEEVNVILSLGGNVATTGTAGLGIKGSTGKIRGYVASEVCDMNGTFTTGQWYHVVTTRAENGLCTLYLDAVAQTDTETTTGNVSNSHSKFIGKDTNAERFYDGVVDDVKLYNRALTPTEIKKNYNATKSKHKN